MIRRLRLRNFKSFHDAEIELGSLTTLVGANASGKSNCRDAIRFLHGVGLGYSLAEILGGRFGPGGIRQWSGIRGGAREVAFHGESCFELTVTLDEPAAQGYLRYALQVDVSDERLGPRVAAESLHRDERSLFSSRARRRGGHKNLEGVSELEVQAPGKEGSVEWSLPAQYPSLAKLPELEKCEAALGDACDVVLRALREMRFLDLDADAMRPPSPPGQTTLGDRGENLSSALQAICSHPDRKRALLTWVRSLTPMDAVDLEFKLDLQGNVLVFLQEASGSQTSAYNASDGTLRFLALTAALLGHEAGQFFFFEEFDNGIHPTRLHLLLNLIQEACQEQGIQVVGTTHNPALLTFLEGSSRRHVVLAHRGEGTPATRLLAIRHLPDVDRILGSQSLGQLLASGWLEDAAAFSEPDEGSAA